MKLWENYIKLIYFMFQLCEYPSTPKAQFHVQTTVHKRLFLNVCPVCQTARSNITSLQYYYN